ncbi:MAG: hypothetical protein KatS3mg050_4573 [Litorilinea sp.]|nr:MAG: hypothetical protein KatS3mg050_4573 [Litorilinea sp.]
MITRFDHAVIAVADLEAAAAQYRRLGLSVYPGGRHTGLGSHNAIVRFGLDYLELIGVYSRDEVLAAGPRRATLVEFLDAHGGGMLGYCLATDDIDGLAAHFRATGLAADGPLTMERARPDGRVLKWRLLLPGGTGWRRPWPFFIQWELPDDERLQWEQPGQHPLGVTRVAGVTVLVRDLDAARQLYGRQLGLGLAGTRDVPALAADGLRFALGDFTIDLLAPRGAGEAATRLEALGEGLFSVTLAAANLEHARELLAAQGFSLEPAPEEESCWLIVPEPSLGARLLLRVDPS